MIRVYLLTAVVFVALSAHATSQTPTTTPPRETQTADFTDTTKAATPPPAKAEEPKENAGESFGIKLMYGMGMLAADPMPSGVTLESAPAFSAGLFWNHSGEGVISFGIQTELLFVSESGLMKMSTLFGDFESTTTTQSIRLPILLKLQFLDRTIIQPSVYAGPSIGYQLSGVSKSGDTETDIENLNGFQYGLAIGVDATFLRIFVVDIRYNMNLSDIAAADENEATTDTSIKMSSLRFGLGLRF